MAQFISRHISRRDRVATLKLSDSIPEAYTGVMGSLRVENDGITIGRTPIVKGKAARKQVGGGTRSVISGFTAQSRRNFLKKARSVEGLTYHLVLTYPRSFSIDGITTAKHWDKMRRWLISRGVGGIAMQEFQHRGAPHRHILTNSVVNIIEARKRWAAIIGDPTGSRYGVKQERIKNIYKIINYLAKEEQKSPPEGYEGVGRYWAVFGPILYKPSFSVVRPLEQIAPLIRSLRQALRKKYEEVGRVARQDKGLYRWSGFIVGGDFLRWLPKLVELYKIELTGAEQSELEAIPS